MFVSESLQHVANASDEAVRPRPTGGGGPLEVIIIGGGQSGLALGYYLARQGRRFVILDAAERIGHAWRSRWDSLRLITPCPYNSLPGMPFPAERWSFPTKDEVADYLERYAAAFQLPVRLRSRVRKVQAIPGGYRVEMDEGSLEAPQVVIATGPFNLPRLPPFASELSPEVLQLHSSHYRNPAQLPEGDALVVGCGNSGAGIARELAAHHKVYLSLGRTGSMPRRVLGRDLYWWAHLLRLTEVTIDSPRGQRWSRQPDGLVGVTPEMLARSGVLLTGRTVGVDGDRVLFEDGGSARIRTLVWATGFRPDYQWIEVPVFDKEGKPVHRRGVTAAPGLFFLGLKWLHRSTSALLCGVGPDAAYLAERLAEGSAAGRALS
jgi:putative flavoprotein involved in K+ transport